ncbi:MAG TPA: hypothetical protein VJ996_05105 [Solirubrobacteraceae bacterium]|nr:hypothetical protein [Solirubrobacteraceae bacterium]
MARSLLRDARDAGVAQAGSGRRGASADDGLSHAVAAEKQSSRVASAENQLSAVA